MSDRLLHLKHRVFPCIAFAGAAATLLFWTAYYSGLFFSERELIRAFEAAFPVSDGLLFVALILCGVGLLKKRRFGNFCMVVAASMALYLGFVDILFYTSQEAYLPLTLSSLLEAFINTLCVVGGATGLWFGWRFWNIETATCGP